MSKFPLCGHIRTPWLPCAVPGCPSGVSGEFYSEPHMIAGPGYGATDVYVESLWRRARIKLSDGSSVWAWIPEPKK